MKLRSQKGYSLIEIGVGILILIVFLWCSRALFNGSYNTYRMIQQRNIATNYAVSAIEELLQTDSDILTGYFVEEFDADKNQYVLKANTFFRDYVEANFNAEFKDRYARINKLNVDAVGALNDKQYEDYIFADKEYLISSYIQNVVENLSDAEYTSEDVQNGNYAFLAPNVIQEGSLVTPTNENNMIIKKTILRLPYTDQEAFGNQILKIKVEVFYTARINNRGVTEDDLSTVTLETIKVANY